MYIFFFFSKAYSLQLIIVLHVYGSAFQLYSITKLKIIDIMLVVTFSKVSILKFWNKFPVFIQKQPLDILEMTSEFKGKNRRLK